MAHILAIHGMKIRNCKHDTQNTQHSTCRCHSAFSRRGTARAAPSGQGHAGFGDRQRRRLPLWHANLGKRLVKSPKVYVRDSGLVHALLGIPDKESLLGHPVVGQSWECFVIENLIAAAQGGGKVDVQAYFYRTSGGAEIDLLLAWPDGQLWAIEIKRSLAPRSNAAFMPPVPILNPQENSSVILARSAIV